MAARLLMSGDHDEWPLEAQREVHEELGDLCSGLVELAEEQLDGVVTTSVWGLIALAAVPDVRKRCVGVKLSFCSLSTICNRVASFGVVQQTIEGARSTK